MIIIKYSLLLMLIFQSQNNFCHGFLNQFFQKVNQYFGRSEDDDVSMDNSILAYNSVVPYEVSEADEKFIQEAAKLTGIELTEIDSCQHRVVLKLKTSCHKMNDQQLAKLAVMLLNCQSAVEGRRIYPCTDAMTIKECTGSMDADAWNSYHLMSNRARAVCYSVRQVQFRGVTEDTINRLMNSARHQLNILDNVSKNQGSLRTMAQETLNAVEKGQQDMFDRQEDLKKAQFYAQLSIENNIKRLGDEKRLISESLEYFTILTRSIQQQLEEASLQVSELDDNRKKVRDDLIAIQEKTRQVFQKIEESSTFLQAQNEIAHKQHKSMLKQLAQINETIHSLVGLVGGSREALEARLNWLTTFIGGDTDLAVERFFAVFWHTTFLLIAMIGCAFINANTIIRLTVVGLVPLNLAATLRGSVYALDSMSLINTLSVLISLELVTIYFSTLRSWNNTPWRALPWLKQKMMCRNEKEHNDTVVNAADTNQRFNDESEERDSFNLFSSPTPPPSRIGDYYYVPSTSKSRSRTPLNLNDGCEPSRCQATTRMSTPCKLKALPGRLYCGRHKGGDSVYGS